MFKFMFGTFICINNNNNNSNNRVAIKNLLQHNIYSTIRLSKLS
jgi:hypothetical protein